MKKFISIIMAILITVSCVSFSAFAENEFIIGDVNGDGIVTAADARLALRVSAQIDTISEDAAKRGDIDKDGRVTAADARDILRIAAMLENAECLYNGHDIVSKKVVAPTCEEQGYTLYVCSRCGEFKSDYVTALGHKYQYSDIKKPTCDGSGYTTYICPVCGKTVDRDFVPATGHSFGSWVTSGNVKTRKCSICGYTETQIISIKTHAVTKKGREVAEKYNVSSLIDYGDLTEGTDITGKILVLYSTGGGRNYGADGKYYNKDGTPRGPCKHCGKILGEGPGMCNGHCAMVFS